MHPPTARERQDATAFRPSASGGESGIMLHKSRISLQRVRRFERHSGGSFEGMRISSLQNLFCRKVQRVKNASAYHFPHPAVRRRTRSQPLPTEIPGDACNNSRRSAWKQRFG